MKFFNVRRKEFNLWITLFTVFFLRQWKASPVRFCTVDKLEMRRNFGAGNETRTRDPDLGKVVLYQLSYSRLGMVTFKFWSGKRDSNSRPRPWQGRALPTELFPLGYGAFKFWSGKRDSNSRPRPWQGRALPTELFPHTSCHISTAP